MNSSAAAVLYLAGEAVFTFPTHDGNMWLCPTDDRLTPFGGLVQSAARQKQCRVSKVLAAGGLEERTNPNAALLRDVLTSFGLPVLCEGRHSAQVQHLRED